MRKIIIVEDDNAIPIDQNASLEITTFAWVPPAARGQVRDLRPRWACEELGLNYAERLIDASNKSKGYFDQQPMGQVPVLWDGGIHMFESGAILLHIAQKNSVLLPVDPQERARAISWLFAALNSVEPLISELYNVDGSAKNEKWAQLRKQSLVDSLGKRLEKLSCALGEKRYLEKSFTVGDLAMASVLRIADYGGSLSNWPNLTRYQKRCLARPAFKRALTSQLSIYSRWDAKEN